VTDGSAKQKQSEPVAWVCNGVNNTHDIDFDENEINDLPVGTMLYTTPQPKQKQGEPVALDVTIEGDNAILLYDFLGEDRDELSPLRLVVGKGHSGYGLYVAQADYQDEGAVLVTSITPPLAKQEQGEIERLIAALKKANEQAEHFEREWYLRGDELEKLKQEQGEPVAQCCSAGIAHDCHAGDGCRIVERIKSTPQPAQKPLTDEQIKSIWRLAVLEAAIKGNATANFARAIEAAHNIKE
jgi:hypothetical protein